MLPWNKVGIVIEEEMQFLANNFLWQNFQLFASLTVVSNNPHHVSSLSSEALGKTIQHSHHVQLVLGKEKYPLEARGRGGSPGKGLLLKRLCSPRSPTNPAAEQHITDGLVRCIPVLRGPLVGHVSAIHMFGFFKKILFAGQKVPILL